MTPNTTTSSVARRRRHRWRRAIAAALAVAMVGGACSGSDDGADGSADGPSVELASDPSTELVESLAAAGIGVFAAPDGGAALAPVAEPASPVQLLSWQARAMEVEATSGGGIAATLIDGEVDTAGDGPPEGIETTPSELILAWAEAGDTPGARYAGELLGDAADLPTEELHLPQLVLVLFASDVATVATALPEPPGATAPASTTDAPGESLGAGSDLQLLRSAPGGEHAASPAAIGPAAAQAGPCSAVARFVTESIAWVFNKIGHLQNPDIGRPGIVGLDQLVDAVNFVGKIVVGGVNVVIDGAHLIVEGLGRIALTAVLDYVAKVAATVGTIAMIASFIRPWSLHLTPEPILVEAPNGGAAIVTIDLGGHDRWPTWAEDCANQAGAPLPPLRPEGNPVAWAVEPNDLIAAGEVDQVLRHDGTASYGYTVVADPPGPGRRTVESDLWITAQVQRDDTRQIQRAFSTLIQGQLGTTVGRLVYGFVRPFAERILTKAFTALEHLRDVRGRNRLTLRYGIEDETTETTEPDGTAAPGARERGVCELVSDAEIARILDLAVDGTEVVNDTPAEAAARGEHPPAHWLGMGFCDKTYNQAAFDDWLALPNDSPVPPPPYASVNWRVDTYTNPEPPKAWIAEFLALPDGPDVSYSHVGGIGDDAIVDQTTTSHARGSQALTFRAGNHLVHLKANPGQGFYATDQFIELAKLIATRLD